MTTPNNEDFGLHDAKAKLGALLRLIESASTMDDRVKLEAAGTEFFTAIKDMEKRLLSLKGAELNTQKQLAELELLKQRKQKGDNLLQRLPDIYHSVGWAAKE